MRTAKEGAPLMAGSVNKVILVGNLGSDPEIRRTQDGRTIALIKLATSESWRDRNTGERREKTEWHRIVVLSDGLAKISEQYLKKGSKVYVEGQLQTRKWQDQEGRDRFSTEIVVQNWNSALHFLDRRQHQSDGESNYSAGAASTNEQTAATPQPESAAPESQSAEGDGEAASTDAPTEEKKEYSDEIPF